MKQVAIDLWFPIRKCSLILGMSDNNFNERVRTRLPANAIRTNKRNVLYYLPEVVATWHKYQLSLIQKPADETDPLLAGGDSPGLERYRMAKAQLAEKDLAERNATMIDRALAANAMRSGVVAMRDTGDRLTRRFGNEAGEMFNDAVTEFEQVAVRAVAGTDAG